VVVDPIPKRRHAAHPHPLLFRGGDLIADALADDLTLELRKGGRCEYRRSGPSGRRLAPRTHRRRRLSAFIKARPGEP